MAIHVLEEKPFFGASAPIGDGQRIVLMPGPRPVSPGDTVFLRDLDGNMTWVADVQLVNSLASPGTWAGHGEEPQPYMIVGLLARIHHGTLPVGRGHLVAHWVTLNSRTIPTILPWLEEGTLVYHHTLRLVEGVLTPQELEQAQKLGCVVNHRSGHWIIPMGDARKRLLSQIRDVPLICSLCGAPIASIEEATVDHRIPSSQGGPDVLANLQLAHKVCNEFKGNALPEQYPPFFVAPRAPSAHSSHWRSRKRGGKRPAAHLPVYGPALGPTNGAALTANDLAVGANGAAAGANGVAPGVDSIGGSANGAPNAAGGGAVRPARPVVSPVSPVPKPLPVDVPAGEVAAASDKPAPAENVPAAAQAAKAPQRPAEKGKRSRGKGSRAKKEAPKDAADLSAPAAGEYPAEPVTSRPSPSPEVEIPASAAASAPAPAAQSAAEVATEPVKEVSEEWLASVQVATWSEFIKVSAVRDWASRTATLRTMGPIRRKQADVAIKQGEVLAEHTGPKGRFALVRWMDQVLLIEEKGVRHYCYQVKMLNCLAPSAYLWYLSQFGRTTPLYVAMALIPLWQSGAADAEGKIVARKGKESLYLRVRDDRMVDCGWAEGDSAVA